MRGIGVDLVLISRFKKIRKGGYRHWNKVFTKQEWEYAFKDSHAAEHLAGIFALKEAAMKACEEAGISRFQNWEVRHRISGAPKLYFIGKTKRNMKSFASVSHNENSAIAFVILA